MSSDQELTPTHQPQPVYQINTLAALYSWPIHTMTAVKTCWQFVNCQCHMHPLHVKTGWMQQNMQLQLARLPLLQTTTLDLYVLDPLALQVENYDDITALSVTYPYTTDSSTPKKAILHVVLISDVPCLCAMDRYTWFLVSLQLGGLCM